jgi:hypothetical protein
MDIAFGMVPFVAFGTVLTIAILVLYGKERTPLAITYTVRLLGWSGVIAVMLSFVGLWNDGRYYTLLTPPWALLSIASFGLLPFKMGPIALVRFLPAVFSVGVFLRLRHPMRSVAKAAIAAVIVYLPFAFSLHALSWIGGIFSALRSDVLSTPADVFRVLVSAQADGYWIRAQPERFFAPIGRQGENSFFGIQAAILFLCVTATLCVLAVRTIRSMDRIGKRLLARSTVLLGVAAVLGFGSGSMTHGPSMSYSDVIAVWVFLVVGIAWLLWQRFSWDIARLTDDERERPHLPIPSGAISINDAELIRDGTLGVSILGSFLLGWPVFLSLGCATTVSILAQRVSFASGKSRWLATSLAAGLTVACFGASALAVAVRDATEPEWAIRFLLAAAVLIAGEWALRHSIQPVLSRLRQAGLACAVMAFALVLARQQASWLLFLPAIGAVFILAQQEDRWRRFRLFPLYFVLGGLVMLAVFLPQWVIKG